MTGEQPETSTDCLWKIRKKKDKMTQNVQKMTIRKNGDNSKFMKTLRGEKVVFSLKDESKQLKERYKGHPP